MLPTLTQLTSGGFAVYQDGSYSSLESLGYSIGAAAVPEPGTMLLLGSGLLGLTGLRRKFKK
jgi:hypothetical protein